MVSQGRRIEADVLLFFFAFGMAATVAIPQFKQQMRNISGIGMAMTLQILILPLISYVIWKVLSLGETEGTLLLIAASAPGNFISTLWCSFFNADLGLSVIMTGISMIGFLILPHLYFLILKICDNGFSVPAQTMANFSDYALIVIVCIAIGVVCSGFAKSTRFSMGANGIGSIAGVIFALLTVSDYLPHFSADGSVWQLDKNVAAGVILSVLSRLLISNYLVSKTSLSGPERVAVVVQTCCQDTHSVELLAIIKFAHGSDRTNILGIIVYYGFFQKLVLAMYCLTRWKLGLTKAPEDETICKVLCTSYEVETYLAEASDDIELVNGETENELDSAALLPVSGEYGDEETDLDGPLKVEPSKPTGKMRRRTNSKDNSFFEEHRDALHS